VARNIEIKARIDDLNAALSLAAAISDKEPIEISQDDTFFACQNGRLKLRAFSPVKGELIFYQRANQAGPKESFYIISPTSTPDALRESLSLAYGQVGRVRKRRTLFLVGRTRIHIDQVDSLGCFIELEVVLSDGEASEAGETIANDLMNRLGISSNQLVDKAYVDLLQQ
jgi:adenylate cyclase class IV